MKVKIFIEKLMKHKKIKVNKSDLWMGMDRRKKEKKKYYCETRELFDKKKR